MPTMANLERRNILFKTKNTNKQQQVEAAIGEEMNSTTQRKVDGRIAEKLKLLILSKNTYKHLKIKNKK
jgi:hypothetical protein